MKHRHEAILPLTFFRCEIRFVQDIQMGDIGFQIRINKPPDFVKIRRAISQIYLHTLQFIWPIYLFTMKGENLLWGRERNMDCWRERNMVGWIPNCCEWKKLVLISEKVFLWNSILILILPCEMIKVKKKSFFSSSKLIDVWPLKMLMILDWD